MPDPWLDDGDIRLYHGDAVEVLREIPAGSVHMCATSPPFYGLRDYGTGEWAGGDPDCDHIERRRGGGNPETSGLGTPGHPAGQAAWGDARNLQPYACECGKCGARRVDQQIGLEETPQEWVDRLVAVFREVRRVLRDDGTLWVEIGDSYHGGVPGGSSPDGPRPGRENVQLARRTGPSRVAGVKPKDLLGQPWLLAFALRADGWYLRSEIIWARPNPMPESVTDRPTKSHSTVFMLSKRPRYFWDADAIREPLMASTLERGYTAAKLAHGRGPKAQANGDRNDDGEPWSVPSGANARSVWTINYEEEWPTGEDDTEWIARIGSCRKCGGLKVAGNGQGDATATATDASGGRENSERTASDTSYGSGQSQTGTRSTTSAKTPDASDPITSNQSPSESTSYEATRPPLETQPRPTVRRDTNTRLRTLIAALMEAGSAACVCENAHDANAPQSVWRVATEPTPFAHFATWPQALVRRMILAGTSERGCCPECGAPWARETEREVTNPGNRQNNGRYDGSIAERRGFDARREVAVTTLGWSPSCTHDQEPIPATVLDCFAGSGTTALVARNHGRHSIGIELSSDYLQIAAKRLQQLSLLT